MHALIQPNRAFSALLCCACFALSSLGVASTALAQSNAQTQSADLHGQFKRLELSKQRGVMTVSYKLSKSTWRRLKQARVEPRLNIHVPNGTRYEYAYSVRLPKRKATLVLPKMNLRGVNNVEVKLVGFEGPYRIASIGVGNVKARRVKIPLVRTGQQQNVNQQPPVQRGRAQVIAACKRNTSYNSEFNDCITRSLKAGARQAPAMIDACGKASAYTSGFKQCLSLAVLIQGNKASAVQACDAASAYDSGLTQCLKRVRLIKSSDPGAVIQACGKATSYDSGAEACIAVAGASTGRMAPAVLACGVHTSYDSEVKSCLVASQRLAVAPGPVIQACGKHTQYSSELNKCIKLSTSLVAGQEGVIHACGQATQYNSGMTSCIKTAAAQRATRFLVKSCGNSTNYDSEVTRCIVRASQPRGRRGARSVNYKSN